MTKFLINFRYAFNIRKPIAMARIAINLIKIYLFKEQPLRYVDISIGNRCNLTCRHCFAAKSNEKENNIILANVMHKSIVSECMKLGAVNFSITGGEPLLYGADLFTMIERLRPKENIVSISTNGTLLTRDMARRLKEAGVDIITLSVDTYRDITVGRYKEIIETAIEAGLKVTIGYTISHQNFDEDLRMEFVRYALEKKIIFMIIYAVPKGRLSGDVELTSTEINTIKRLTEYYPYVRTDHQSNYRFVGCGGGTEILYITNTGDVQFCAYIDKPFGNVWDEDIAKIRKRILRDKFLNSHRDICVAAQKPISMKG